MKNFLKYSFLLIICIISSVSCNNTITRFWNGDGWYPSPKKQKAYSECFQESIKNDPPLPQPIHEDMSSEESRKRRHDDMEWISQCVRNKGF